MTFPTTPILDNFNRADGGLGANWTTPSTWDAVSISSNQFLVDINCCRAAIWSQSAYGPDCEAYFTLSGITGSPIWYAWGFGIIFRSADTDLAGVYGQLSIQGDMTTPGDSHWYILGSSGSTLADGAFTANIGDSFGISMVGDLITAYHKPSAGSWTVLGTATDSGFSGAGYIGLLGNIDTGSVSAEYAEDFGGGTITGGGGCVGSGPAYVVNCRALRANGTGAVGLRVSNTAYALNTRTDATTGVVVDNGGTLNAYGLQYGSATLTGTGALVPLAGDRSAYDALNYQAVHANDIDNAVGVHHSLGTGAAQSAAGNHTHGSFSSTITTTGHRSAVVTKTSDYTLASTDEIIICDTSTTMTINLPAATGTGQWYEICAVGTGAVTIDANGSETLDGELTQVLSQWETIQIVDYDSGKWKVI